MVRWRSFTLWFSFWGKYIPEGLNIKVLWWKILEVTILNKNNFTILNRGYRIYPILCLTCIFPFKGNLSLVDLLQSPHSDYVTRCYFNLCLQQRSRYDRVSREVKMAASINTQRKKISQNCSSDFHNSVFGTPRYSLYVRVMTSAYVRGQPGF